MIPLILTAAPLIQPLVMSLVVHMERLFGHKTGPTKLDNVVTTVFKVLDDLSTAGKIPGSFDKASVTQLVESIVADLNQKGVLNPETIAQNDMSLASGSVWGYIIAK
jgi:hypothetical protein